MKGTACIITGAGTGIGRSAAIKLARLGASVVLVGRTAARLEEVRREIEAAGGVALAAPGDVTDMGVVRCTVQATLQAFGRIDVLVNNAGYSTRNRSILTITPKEFDEVVRVNLWAPMFFTQAVLPTMLKAKCGTIINVSSRAVLTPSGLGGPIYGAAKAGLVNFTKALNIELKNTGVRACSIVPGEVDTPILEKRPVPPPKEARATMLAADDVADAIVLVASLPPRALVDELFIRPTHQRDVSRELPPPPKAGA